MSTLELNIEWLAKKAEQMDMELTEFIMFLNERFINEEPSGNTT